MSSKIVVREWLLNNYAQSGPVNLNYESKDATFKYVERSIDLNDESLLKEGEALIKTIYLSNDPAQKGWFADKDSYRPKSPLNVPAPSSGLFKVIKSKSNTYPEGLYVQGILGWANYQIVSDKSKASLLPIKDPKALPKLSNFVGILGTTTATAYFGVFNHAELKEGEGGDSVALVTGAAGGVGSKIVEILSSVIKTKKIIAVVGGEAKLKYVESLGDNVIGVDYRKESFHQDLEKAFGNDTVDYFFDQVGGEILSFAIQFMSVHGKILQCGAISSYNDPEKNALKNYSYVVVKRLTIKGYLVLDDFANYGEFIATFTRFIKEGKIDPAKSRETIVDATGENFKKVPELWTGLFKGVNVGKYLTKVSSDEE